MMLQTKLIGLLLGTLAIIALAAGIHIHGVSQGKKLERAAWQAKEIARKDAEQEAYAAAVETNRLIQKAHDANNQQISADHQVRLAALRADRDALRRSVSAAGGLRLPRSLCPLNAAGPEAAGDSRHHGDATAAVRLPDAAEDFLLDQAYRADEIVEQARTCQNWIRTHGFYGGN